MKRISKRMRLMVLFIFLLMSASLYADDFSYDELDPDTRNLYIDANAAKRSGNDLVAIEKYEQLIKILPKAHAFKQDLVDIYVKNKNWKSAEKYSKELLTIDPQNKDYQLQYARILLWSKKSKMSLSELESLLLSDPRDVKAMTELAQIYLTMKEEEKAQNVFRKILQVNPGNDNIKMDLAYSHLRQKEGAEALEVFKKVRAGSEHYGQSTKELTSIYLNQNDYVNAREALIKARKIYPRDRVLLEQLANVCLWLKNYDEAETYFKQLKKNWPTRAKDWNASLKALEAQKASDQLATRPGVEWYSSFYSETQAGSTPRAVNLTSLLSYRWPLNEGLRFYFDSGLRSDQAVGISPIGGLGVGWSFLSNASLTLRSRMEPDKSINISNWNSASLIFSPLLNMDLEYDYELTNYHDQNQSQQNSYRMYWREVVIKPLKLNFEHAWYRTNQQSAYFVRIDKAGSPRTLQANQISVEYEIPVTASFTISPGYAYREELEQSTAHTVFLKSHWLDQGTQYDGSVYYREDSLGYRYWFGYLAVNFIF